MIWLAVLILVVIPMVIWAVLIQEEQVLARRRSPMGWLRRWWPRAASERRRHPRYRAAIPLSYRVLNGPAAPRRVVSPPSAIAAAPVVATTRDISCSGLGIVLYEKLAPATVLELALRCESPTGTLTVQGQVQWVREVPSQAGDPRRLFWAGIQLVSTGTASAERLRQVLQQMSPDGRQGRV